MSLHETYSRTWAVVWTDSILQGVDNKVVTQRKTCIVHVVLIIMVAANCYQPFSLVKALRRGNDVITLQSGKYRTDKTNCNEQQSNDVREASLPWWGNLSRGNCH